MTNRRGEDQEQRSVSLEVQAPRAEDLVDAAIAQAARALRESPADLYAAEVGRFHPTGRSKYRPHLGVQGPILGWRASIVVRIRPEVLKARRGDRPPRPGRGGLRSVD